MSTKLRCAVYTRKSTTDGLEQDFNSLDAQRESCEAYIKSQQHEGWKLLADKYDDGGISGGTMERPALQRLLEEVRAGRVDIIVVYKVDRLTRALSDFARMVDLFDEHEVSFVSVTQQFNTTTSMGRLTLNVLLSFAQFEREVTAERIRDKITASKKKGMWMGGLVPLGYDAIDKKLVVNEAEAKTVRTLFNLYLKFENVRRVKEEINRLGLRTKERKPNNGSRSGGMPFTRGHIYKILSNPTYVGEVAHKGEVYPGEHDPIIDQDTWDRVRSKLKQNAINRKSGANSKSPGLLAGLLWDEDNNRLVPHFACKKDKRYRYYVSRAKEGRKEAGWRLPAGEIESVVLEVLVSFLSNEREIIGRLAADDASPDGLQVLMKQASEYAGWLTAAPLKEQRIALQSLACKIVVSRHQVSICISRGDLIDQMGNVDAISASEGTFTIDIPVAIRKRGVGKKLIVGSGDQKKTYPDPKLIEAVAKGNRWFHQLRTGEIKSVAELARVKGVDRRDAGRTVALAFLAPGIIEAILSGKQPIELTVSHIKQAIDLPYSWSEQREILGFTA